MAPLLVEVGHSKATDHVFNSEYWVNELAAGQGRAMMRKFHSGGDALKILYEIELRQTE